MPCFHQKSAMAGRARWGTSVSYSIQMITLLCTTTVVPADSSACLLRAHIPLRLRGGAEWGGQSCDDATPCIGHLQDFQVLDQFYGSGESNEVFRRKLGDLKNRYRLGFRPVKGDGNCFIRGENPL